MAKETSIFGSSIEVLKTGQAIAKADRAQSVAASWRDGDLGLVAAKSPLPDRPERPKKPVLAPPSEMPRRRLGSITGRQSLLHAVAHIELNAIDLAFDMIARFGPDVSEQFQTEFISDWVRIGDEEAKHFLMIQKRLEEMDTHYGALPAHDGLWEAALNTRDNVLARLTLAPCVLEARGLDVTPQMIANFEKVGDQRSAECLKVIYEEEIGHVSVGSKWLNTFCQQQDLSAKDQFQHFVKTRFMGQLKEPFNHDARKSAGLDKEFYQNITQ